VTLEAEVVAFIRDPAPDPARFDELALRLWRWQLDGIPLYRRFCEGRGATAEDVRSWRDVPALPVEAFKVADLVHAREAVTHRFMTSGTSSWGRQYARAGSSLFGPTGLSIMDEAVVVNAERMLFRDRRHVVLVLAPPPDRAPHMIMAYGMRRLLEVFGLGGSRFLIGECGIDEGALFESVAAAHLERAPVCLIGASFGFVNLLEGLERRGAGEVPLPPGSLVVDAGGYKGRSRELSPEEFRALCSRAFHVPEAAIVNLLGMTELSSQIYDAVGDGSRRKLPPPWMRSRVVEAEDPDVDVGDGEIGVLRHFDLASHGRPCAILSDDLGRRRGDGFEIVGRVRAGASRGCSIKVDELLAAAAP
jgi:hypothetical protein